MKRTESGGLRTENVLRSAPPVNAGGSRSSPSSPAPATAASLDKILGYLWPEGEPEKGALVRELAR